MIELLIIAGGVALLAVGFYSKPTPQTPTASAPPGLAAFLQLLTTTPPAAPSQAPAASLVPAKVLAASSSIAAALAPPVSPIKPAPTSATMQAQASTGGAVVFNLGNSPQTIQGVTLNLGAKQNGILVNGANHTIKGVTFHGGDIGILVDGATSNTTIDGYTYTDETGIGYGIYLAKGGKDQPNDHVTQNNCFVTITRGGQHCERVYAATNWTLTNSVFSHHGTYGGATLNVKQVSTFYWRNVQSFGRPIGFGANESPSEMGYLVEDGLIEDCHFSAMMQVIFHSGTRNLTFRRCTFEVTEHVGILQFKGAYGSRFQPYNIKFEECAFVGGSKVAEGKTEAASYAGCTWNGATI